MPNLCTFCDNPLDGSEEHILLSALGGRKRSTRVICAVHNNAFGSTIDVALTRQLAYFCNILGIQTGRREPSATLRNLVTTGGERVDVAPGGRMIAQTQINDTLTSPNQRSIDIAVASEERLRTLLPQYLRRHRRGTSDLENAVLEERIEPGAAIDFEIDLGDEEAFRCVAKMGLLLLASAVGTHHVRGVDTAGIRSFILDGSGAWDGLRREYETDFSRPAEHITLPAYAHRIGAVADASAQLAYAQVELFGMLRYTVIISEDWSGPAAGLQYGVNPVDGSGSDVHNEPRAIATASQIKARNATAQEINERVRAIWPRVHERQQEIAVNELVADSMERAFADLEEGAEIPDDVIEKLVQQAAGRYMAVMRNVPYREPLDLARVLRTSEDEE